MTLNAEHVSRTFFRQGKGTNYFYAVRDANISLRPGILTEITGRSGSGKSTLLNVLAGLLTPTEGKILLDDTELYALEDAERSRKRNACFGIIPQGHTCLHSLTVLENVKLPTVMYQKTPCTDAQATELLESVGIAGLASAYPGELSGGELRRLAIARALVMRPGILLADEPTGDLDDENTKTVLELLRRCADDGMAVLLVTHEREAAVYADKKYTMSEGVLTEKP